MQQFQMSYQVKLNPVLISVPESPKPSMFLLKPCYGVPVFSHRVRNPLPICAS